MDLGGFWTQEDYEKLIIAYDSLEADFEHNFEYARRLEEELLIVNDEANYLYQLLIQQNDPGLPSFGIGPELGRSEAGWGMESPTGSKLGRNSRELGSHGMGSRFPSLGKLGKSESKLGNSGKLGSSRMGSASSPFGKPQKKDESQEHRVNPVRLDEPADSARIRARHELLLKTLKDQMTSEEKKKEKKEEKKEDGGLRSPASRRSQSTSSRLGGGGLLRGGTGKGDLGRGGL